MSEPSQSTDVLLVLDVGDALIDSHNDIIYWNGYAQSKLDGVFSIPRMVEENANYLKAKYLELIYEFGEVEVDEKSIIENLKIRKNFSYWWMTLLVEKCNYSKSPQIDNIIKLIELEQWLQENKYQKIRLITANNELAAAVFLLTKKLLIDFEWRNEQGDKTNFSLMERVFYTLPNTIQALIWLLRYLLSNWSLKGAGVKEWRKTTATTTFISYFFNIKPESEKHGRYESRYWTTLIDLLEDKKHPTNWLHIYVKDDLLPSAKKAHNLIQRFNRSQNGNQVHVTLASFLTIPLVFHTLKDWYKVLKLNRLVCKQLRVKSDYLWPLFKKDCQNSISGIRAISNLLYFNLFEKAMGELPAQKKGCYLQENQGWEFGFISAWKSAGHGKNLIGFPHSTVRYWDLRYFFDPRSYERKGEYDLPLPSHVGVNGRAAKKMYVNGGYPQNKLIKVEALRYLHIPDSIINQNKRDDDVSKEKVVLVVGDYLKENTDLQLEMLSSALVDINQSARYIIKPHPACPINMEDFPGLSGELSIKPISELLAISDVVYSSATTSAAVDAYCVGLPVITLLDGKTLDLSPLKYNKGVYFVKNFKELATAINDAKVTDPEQGENYFCLDTELPRWHEWLINDK